MLEAIISYLTQKLSGLFPEFEIHCLAEKITADEKEFPAVYLSESEYKPIDFDSAKGTIYFRRNGEVETTREEEEIGCGVLETHKIPVKVVLLCRKDIYGTDNPYIDNKVAENLRSALIVNDDRVLRGSLKCDSVYVHPVKYSQDRKSIIEEEFKEELPKVGFEFVLVSVDLDISVTGQLSCFEYWTCGDSGSVTFCKLSKVISSDGTTLIDLGPGGLYTVQDSQITNTDGTLLKSLPAEQGYEVQDSLVINTNGDIIDLVPAEETGIVGNSLIKDSSGATLHSVPATQSQTIADSTIYKADGVTQLTTVKAEGSKTTTQIIALMSGSEIKTDLATDNLTDDVIQALTASTIYANMTAAQKTAFLKLVSASELNGALSLATRQKILYIAQLPSGQETSRRTGDAPYYGNLHHRLIDYFTLRDNNMYGITNRFTDELGNYYTDAISGAKNTPTAYANNLVIDHATGIMYEISTTLDTWTNGIDACEAYSLTVNGTLMTDWFMPGLMQMFSIIRITGGGGSATSYYPFRPTLFNLAFHTATPKNSTTDYGINADGEEFLNTMTTVRAYIRARLMTDAELGL